MAARYVGSVVTVPEMERIGEKLARLYPQTARLVPSEGGAYREEWQKETPATIDGAIGLYTQGRPMRKFPGLLLRLKCWPESIPKGTLLGIIGTTTGVLAWRFERHWGTIPKPQQAQIATVLQRDPHHRDDGLASMLLDEFRLPSPCWKCKGHGKVRTRNDADNLLAPIIIDCPQCHGTAEGPKSLRSRAEGAGMSPYHFKTYVQRTYDHTLHGFRFMADHAARGVLDKLS